MTRRALISSDDVKPRGDMRAYLQQHPLRDASSKCAAPPCDARVAYAGDFCRSCMRVQADMRARLRARRT